VLDGLFSADLLSVGRKGSIVSRNVQVDSENYVYQIYVPPDVEKIKDTPLIVFLHGIRERGSGSLTYVHPEPANNLGGYRELRAILERAA
jgi:hypothetical protein